MKPKRLEKCFVMMPFRSKKLNGKAWHFDTIFADLIQPGALQAGLLAERCDTSADSGPILAKMFEGIYDAAFVVADITSANPNVMYELGLRHAFCPSGTLIVKGETQGVRAEPHPFNVAQMAIWPYRVKANGALLTTPTDLEMQIRQVRGLNTSDSPIHRLMSDLRVSRDSKPLTSRRKRHFKVTGTDDRLVGYLTGDIKFIRDVDYWVNSENTNMQMARPFEQSISSTIRALGADNAGEDGAYTDTISEALRAQVGPGGYVHPGTVKITTPGALAQSNNVKALLHVASVKGAVGKGYRPVDELELCVHNAIDAACRQARDDGLTEATMLFPLLGVGQARGEANGIAFRLVEAAAEKLAELAEGGKSHPIRAVYFLAYTERDQQILERVTTAMTPRSGTNRILLEEAS